MSSIKGTKTEKNLLTAFAGEAQARNRYDYFASKAKKDGYVQVSQIFAETALQEKEHAKRLFKFMEGGDVEIQADYPCGGMGTTEENLRAAASGEHHEHESMYPEFADTAQEEGFPMIAAAMRSIAIAEKQHEKRFLDLAENIEQGRVFKREEKVVWRCINCGFIIETTEPPAKCPACDHEQKYFELLGENW